MTDTCNLSCEDCYLKHSDKVGANSKENILYGIKLASLLGKRTNGNGIIIFGGEPFLELELAEFTNTEAKKEGLQVTAFSNGWWGDNEEVTSRIYNMNLDILVLSVDDMHFIDIKKINKIIDNFKDHPITKVVIATLYGKTNAVKRLGRDDIYAHVQEFVDNNGINPTGMFTDHGFCLMQGLNLHPNGDIRCDCPIGINSCKLGTTKDDINILAQKVDSIWDYFPFFPKDRDLTFCVKNHNRNIFNKDMMQSPYFSMDFWLKKAYDKKYIIR